MILAASLAPAPATAQTPATVDSLRQEVERLRVRIDSLMRVVARLEGQRPDTAAAPADEVAAIRAAAAAAAAAGAEATAAEDTAREAPTRFVGRQRSQQELNPEITITGDVFALADFDDPDANNFVPREFELSLQSPLDPYSLAKIFIGYHLPGGEIVPFGAGVAEGTGEAPAAEDGHEGEVAVEEGYLLWTGLGRGTSVTLGRFRQDFGTLNRWHPHALPGQALPLPYLAFFGEEGLAQSGLGIHWLAPWTGFGTWEVWTQATVSEDETLFGDARNLSVLGRVNAFWDLSRSTYFEVGASGITGPDMQGDDAFGTRVAGVDFTLSWRPPERSRYREATLRGGVVHGRLAPEGPDPGDAWGGFAIGEYRLDQRWILGARTEYTENPRAPSQSAWLAAPTLTWWQSEWVRLRAEFDYLDRPDGIQKLLLLQATFAMGPHKHENY